MLSEDIVVNIAFAVDAVERQSACFYTTHVIATGECHEGPNTPASFHSNIANMSQLFTLPNNVELKQLTRVDVLDEHERTVARRTQGNRKRGPKKKQGKAQPDEAACIADICVFDGNSDSLTNAEMFGNASEAADVQCSASLPTNVLDVIRANTEAAIACESSKDAEVANDASLVLSVESIRQREEDRKQRAEARVLRQRKALAALKKNRKRRVSVDAKSSFDLDGPALSADQRWEGADAPRARQEESNMAPDDPGPPANPRPLVRGIEPFIKYGYLPPLHKLFLQRVAHFYTPRMLRKVLVPLVDQSADTALRQLDWLVTNYAKAKNLYVVGYDGQQRHVYTWYVLLREALRKRHFEPFGKKWRVAFEVDGEVYKTTAGQAVFLMEAYNAGVLQYAKRHCAEIDMHLREQHTKRNERKAAAKAAGVRYKRSPLTTTRVATMTVVQELSDAEDGDDFAEGEDGIEYMRRQQRSKMRRTR